MRERAAGLRGASGRRRGRAPEDAYDYGGFAVDVGGAEPQAQDEWDPIRFY